jgi:hypothetical protein
MSIIRQGRLFDMQDLYELEPSKRFEAVFLLFTLNHYYLRLIKSQFTVHRQNLIIQL